MCWRSRPATAASALRRQRMMSLATTLRRQNSSTSAAPSHNASDSLPERPPAAASSSSSSSSSQKFSSTIRFPIPDSKVTADNLPSAKELDGMIPSLADLKRQIPSATEMEKKYFFRDNALPQDRTSMSSSSSAGSGATAAEEEPLHPNADTPEELLDEMRYGADDEAKPPPPTSQQVALAWRALAWGTVIATIGVLLVTVVGLYVSGFHSVSELRSYLAGREEREQQRLRSSVGDDDEVRHFVLDLTKPLELPEQVERIFAAVQQMAEEEAASTSVSTKLS